MKLVTGWRAFWCLKGGQPVQLFIVENTKYVGNNSGGMIGVAVEGYWGGWTTWP